jgi:hypothetical protein
MAMPKEEKAVWQFHCHAGALSHGYGSEGEAYGHCAALNAGRTLNLYAVRRVNIGRTKFNSMVKSGQIFDLAGRLAEDQKRHARLARETYAAMHYGAEPPPPREEYE